MDSSLFQASKFLLKISYLYLRCNTAIVCATNFFSHSHASLDTYIYIHPSVLISIHSSIRLFMQPSMQECMYTYILIYVQTDTHIECVCVYSYTGVCTITHLLYLKYDD